MPTSTASGAPDVPDFNLTDEDLRRSFAIKWNYAEPGVLPAWVAEMDVRACPAVQQAMHDAVSHGVFGYPPADERTGLPEATAEFVWARFGWKVDPARVVLTGDVMAGILLVLRELCEPGPVVIPVPSYPPFLDGVPLTGRPVVQVPCRETGATAELDLDAIDRALADGARTVLLANPHNPLGRVWTAEELAALRDVVLRHAARVISDEIHAPLVLPGVRHVPYASLDGTAGHVVTVLSASKAWNLPGLKCAQIVAGSDADAVRLRAVPIVANHGTSPLGILASVAAYRDGGPWLDGLVVELARRCAQFTALMAEHLPHLPYRPPEATYLAWVDARPAAVGETADPAATALARGRVMVHPGRLFGAGYEGFVRINFATSAERLQRIVAALATAWAPPP